MNLTVRIIQMKRDFDSMAKIAVIGDSSVGKTNLLLRYVNADYHQTHVATIGIDFKVKTVDLDGYRIKLQIWDTAGQERFRNLTGTIYQGAESVILTYAIDNRSSFDNLTRWLNDVKNFAKKEVIVAIVGNKCDLEAERAVKKEEGLALAKKIDAIFFEASALTNTNVDELFRAIAKALYKKIAEKSAEGQQKKGEEESHPKQKKQGVVEKRKEQERKAKEQDKGKGKAMVLNNETIKQTKKKKCC